MNPNVENPNEPEHYEVSDAELAAAREQMARRMTGHNWRQQGTQVYCTSCPFQHGFSVPPGQLLTGISSEGHPEFKKFW